MFLSLLTNSAFYVKFKTLFLLISDQKLFLMLRIYEQEGNMLSQHFPLSWGKNAIDVYKEKQAKKEFLNDPSTEIFSALDMKTVTKTAYEFPVHLRFNVSEHVMLRLLLVVE